MNLKTRVSDINTHLQDVMVTACDDPTLTMRLYGLCHKRTVQNDVSSQTQNRTVSIVRPVEDSATKPVVTIENTGGQQIIAYHIESGATTSENVASGNFFDQVLVYNMRFVIAGTTIEAIEEVIQSFRKNIKNVQYIGHTSNTENILRNDFAIDLNKKGYPAGMVAYSIEYRIHE